MALEAEIIDVGNGVYHLSIDGFIVSAKDSLENAAGLKGEIDIALDIGSKNQLSPSNFCHATGWKYTGVLPIPPEFFINDGESEALFLTRISELNEKINSAHRGA